MKTIGVILLLAAIVAFFTIPSQNKFNNYLAKKGKDVGKCSSLANPRHYSYKIFSLDYVDYCVPVANAYGETIAGGGLKAHTDKYLGIFGMFFKL